MTLFDYIVLTIVGITILTGLMRGAVKEVCSFAGWLLAIYVAKTHYVSVLKFLPVGIPGEALKVAIAFFVLFLVVLLCCSLLSVLLTQLVKAAGLGGFNRLIGGLAGALRGLMLVALLVMLAAMTDLPKDPRWTTAMLSAPIEALVQRLLPWMPDSIRRHVHLNQTAVLEYDI